MNNEANKQAPVVDVKITVGGVTFSAKDVKSAVVTIDGRDIQIGEVAKADARVMGFSK